jgi:hypothetical protein
LVLQYKLNKNLFVQHPDCYTIEIKITKKIKSIPCLPNYVNATAINVIID